LTDNNNTITEDNYESRDQVQSEKIEQKSKSQNQHVVSRSTQQRHSKSASQNIKSDQTVSRDNRHKSAPIHRNQYGHSRHELTRNYDQSRSNAALMRKTESKMNDLSVTGKIVSSGYKSRNQQTKTSTQPVRPQRRYSGVHKNNSSTGVPKQTIGGGHSQQYGTVSAQWLREHS